MDDRIRKLVEESTAGLKDDIELRLDVSRELESHIEDTAKAFAAEGHPDDESAELAVKSFGSPMEVAGELLDANRKRMKLRALARLAVRALLVPAAVVVALLMVGTTPVNEVAGAGLARLPKSALFSSPQERANLARLRFLLVGDPARPTAALRRRAVWESQPKSRVYFASYALTLLGEKAPNVAVFEREMHQGMKLDPDNALYDYLLAARLLSMGAEDHSRGSKISYVIKDRRLVDRAMAEFRAGLAKPRYSSYRREFGAELASLIPPQSHRTFVLPVMLPLEDTDLLAAPRELVRFAPEYAKILIAEGRKPEAQSLLGSWYPLTVEWLRDANSIMDVMIGSKLAAAAEKTAAPIYEQMGRADLAQRDRQRARRMLAPYLAWHKTTAANKQKEDATVQDRGGIFLAILSPILGPRYISRQEMDAARSLDYMGYEGIIATTLVVLFVILIAQAYALSLGSWLGLRTAKSAPILLLPSWRSLARIFGLSIVFPLALHLLYINLPMISARDYSITHAPYRFGVELLLLCVALLVLPGNLSSKLIRRRCRDLGVPIPTRKEQRRVGIPWTIGVIGLVIIFGSVAGAIQGGWAWWVVLFAAVFGMASALSIRLQRSSSCRLYTGTVARSQVPIYAGALLLVALFSQIYFARQEAVWGPKDPMSITVQGSMGITRVEQRFVTDMKAKMLRAVGER